MTKQEFIDNLFAECGDALIEGDVDTIMDYFEKHYNELSPEDFESVFVKTISNIMDKSELEKYKQKFGYYLYMYLANLFGIQDVYIPTTLSEMNSENSIKLGALRWKVKQFKFKTVTIDFGESVLKFGRSVFTAYNFFECDELIITGNSIRNDIVPIKCKVKTITFDTYIEKVEIDSCNNLCFNENAVIYNDNIPVLMKEFYISKPDKVEKVILPPVDGVQVPRWVCTKLNKAKVTIYKEAGQKIRIFSVYREWVTEHVKSI